MEFIARRLFYLVHGRFLDGDVHDAAEVIKHLVEGFLCDVLVHLGGDETHVHGVDHRLLRRLLCLGVVDGPPDSARKVKIRSDFGATELFLKR